MPVPKKLAKNLKAKPQGLKPVAVKVQNVKKVAPAIVQEAPADKKNSKEAPKTQAKNPKTKPQEKVKDVPVPKVASPQQKKAKNSKNAAKKLAKNLKAKAQELKPVVVQLKKVNKPNEQNKSAKGKKNNETVVPTVPEVKLTPEEILEKSRKEKTQAKIAQIQKIKPSKLGLIPKTSVEKLVSAVYSASATKNKETELFDDANRLSLQITMMKIPNGPSFTRHVYV